MSLARHLSSPNQSSPSSRQQLDARQNVFISITPAAAPALSSTADNQAKMDIQSFVFSPSSTTRTSTPSSASSADAAAAAGCPSTPSSASTVTKRRHCRISHDEPEAADDADVSADADSSSSNGQAVTGSSKGGKGSRAKRAKGGPRGTRGLRFFSILVCRRLSERQQSSYNDIADILINESRKSKSGAQQRRGDSASASASAAAAEEEDAEDDEPFDEKNIRRRIYDALNVLMAIDMIVKEKKIIRWNGPPILDIDPACPTSAAAAASASPASLPLSSASSSAPVPLSPQERLARLREARAAVSTRVREKRALLTEQVLEYVGMRQILERNAEADSAASASSSSASPSQQQQEEVRLYFPFVLINTRRETTIDCEMSERHDAVSMRYSDVFSVHDQTVVVRMLGKGREKLWENIPRELQGLVVGLEEAKRRCEEERRARGEAVDDEAEEDEEEAADDDEHTQHDGTEEEAEDDDEEEAEMQRKKRKRPAKVRAKPKREREVEQQEEEEDGDESELDRPQRPMTDEELQGSLMRMQSSASSSHYQAVSPYHGSLLQYPMQPLLPLPPLYSSSPFLFTPSKHALPFAASPSSSFLCSPPPPLSGYTAAVSQMSQLFSPRATSPFQPSLPMRSLSSASRLSAPSAAAAPVSSSRLFGSDVTGVRRVSSVVIGNSSIIKQEEDELSSAQIIVS